MQKENTFLDKITLTITIVCIVVISTVGIIFLKIENENKSTIIKADDSRIIEQAIDSAAVGEEYNAELYGLININTAPKEDLMLLETIGEKTADAIIGYRTTHPFKTTRDITKIKGIGEKTYEKIKDKICVE